MKIQDLTSRQVKVFHNRMARELGVKYYGDPGFAKYFIKMFYDRIVNKYIPLVPEDLFKARPCTLKNRIYLPYRPGSSSRTPLQQILIAVHEATHALRIRKYPGTAANWYSSYFTNDDFRALEETSCQEAEAEILFWAFGDFGELDLDDYYIGEAATRTATIAFEKRARRVKKLGRGAALERSSAVAIKILRALKVTRDK
jgi:hypothetical protein